MNKIYKVVWNTVRNCYVVGSELISSKSGRHSTSNGKSSSLKVTLTVLALCGMTALGSGVSPAYAADAGATTAMNQYVALKYDSSNNQNETYERINGKRQTVTTFGGQKYIKVNSGVTDTAGRPVYYWVREGYSLTMVDGQPYTSLSSNGRRADVSWTGDANAKPSDILESVTSTHVQTNVTTNVGETLQQVNAGTYAGVTNSGGTEVAGTWDYIVKDSSWKGIVSDSNYSNGYADLVSNNGKPRGFVRTTDAGSKLAWNATLNAYTYNGKVVDYSNIYVIDGEIGVFTNASGSEVYTGTVFGKNNEVLMTAKKSDGNYYSYWGAEVNDAGATMDTYRVAEYQKDLNVLRDNDFALYHNDIKSVDMSTDTSSATISLMRNGDGTSNPAVDGTLTITNGGGTGGNDTYVRISNTTNGQEVSKTFSTGSKVEAVKATESATDITGLKINGETYNIKTGQTYTAGDNITINGNEISATDTDTTYTAGDNVSISNDNKISATNTTLVAGEAEKKGDSYIVKDTAGNEVTLEDVASANKLTEVNNQVTENTQNITRNTQNITKNTTNITELGEKLKGAVMYDSTATGFNKNNVTLGGTTYDSATKTGGTKITNLARGTNDSDAVNFSQLSEVKDAENYVISGSLSKTDGTITLNRLKDGPVTITGLNDYVKGIDSYVTSATLNGNTLTLTRNQGLDSLTVDLSSLTEGLNTSDYRVVANPAKDSGGIYKPDASGNIELTVQDTKTGATATVQLSDIASATTVTNNYTTLDTKIDNTRTDITNEYNTAIDNAKTEIQNDYNTKIDAAKTHYYSVNSSATGEGSNYNNDGAVGLGSIAVGANAYANGRIGASAFGNRAYADGEIALAVGYGSKAQGLAAIAIGTGSRHGADGTDAIAIGEQSYAKGNYTTAVGGYSQAVADGATAFGQQAVASGSNSTAIGIQSQALGNQSTAVGDYSKTEGIATAAFGGHSKTTGDFATALGYASKSVTRGTAVGAASSVTGETGTALGLLSTASANGSVALGAQSSADIDAGVTGYNPNAVEGEDLTSPTWTSTLGAVSVGAAATVDKDGNPVAQKTRQITNLAAGTVDTDAVNVAQLKKSRVELTDGTNTTVNSTNDETDGHVIYSVDVKTNGTINEGDTNIVTGDTVYNALQNVSWKAQVNGTDAKTVKKDGTLNFIDGDNIAITSNDNGDIKISTTGLASSGDLWTAQAGGTDVNAVNQKVNFVGSDHITVTGTDGQIKFEATGLADTDFTNITNNAITKIQNIAKGEDVHIKADTYTVGNDGSVTMTYVDGNGNPVTGEAKITGIAKSDLSNITNEGNNVINNIAKEAVKVVGGMNTTVEPSTTTDGPVEYKVNLNEDVNLGDTIYLNGSDGSISATSGGAQLAFNNSGLTVSQAKNGLTNETRIDGATITVDGGAGNQTIINGSTAHIGSVLVNGGSGTATISGLTNQTTKYDGFANGSGRAATEEQLKEVDSKAAAAKTTVTKGKNITVDEAKAADGSSTYTVGLETDVVLGDNAIKLNGSDGSISAKSGTSSLNFNDKGLSLSNGKNSTVINGGTITVNGGDSVISGTQATFGKITLNAESGSTITGLSNTTTKYDGFATAGRAATEEQLKEVAGQAGEAIKTAGKGWNLTTKGASDSKTNIAPGGTVDFSSSNDNLVISNAGADLSFSLSDNLDLTNNKDKKGSVKVGENTTLTDELLQVGKDVSLTASALNVGTSSLTTSALTVGGLTYISSSGLNANNRVISNVATGVADTDAVNVGQLKSAISGSQVSIKAGDGISVNKAGNQYTINVNIEGLSNEHGTVSVSTDSDSSVIPKSTPTESETITPAPAKRMNSLLVAEDAVVEPENSTSTGEKMYVKYTSNEVKLITDDITNPEDAVTLNDGEKIDFVGGKNITTSSKQGTDTDGKNYDKITFSLKDDISVTSVTADKVTINNGPTINENGIDMNGKNITNTESITINNGPTINSSGIDMNSQKITNLADGEIAEGSTDAVNGGQLYNTNQAVIANAENINSLSHSLNKLDSRINRVGAGAAALAALHPLDFDPDNKWDFAAGYGNYAGANAVAIGTYYRPNENTMFSIGGSFGGGENMINAGVSFKLGSGGSGITTSKTVMAKKIKEQDELLKAQDAKMKEQDEKIAKLEALVAQQGEMIQQALGKK